MEQKEKKRMDVKIVWFLRDMRSNLRTVCMLYIVYAITIRIAAASNILASGSDKLTMHQYKCLCIIAMHSETFLPMVSLFWHGTL